jgi:predicted nucleic acid-binding protein
MSVWATLQADAEKAGHRLPAMDSLIAATALCHGLTLATRNTDDFRHCGIPVLNPWIRKKGPA